MTRLVGPTEIKHTTRDAVTGSAIRTTGNRETASEPSKSEATGAVIGAAGDGGTP